MSKTLVVRTQYFFVPSEEGYNAWDVDRLVALSVGLPVCDVPLSSIEELDTAHWFGADGGPTTVRIMVEHLRLINDVDPSYPIILGAAGKVMDGMHRVARALLEGRTTVKGARFETQPDPDFRDVRPEELPY